MKAFKIVYCFTDKNGIIETNEYGEVIYTELVHGLNNYDALNTFLKKENFIKIPDILDIEEVQI